jgi:periplasmic divalent cation tolerance protein
MTVTVLIYSLFPSAGEAHDCCRILMEERLIACANRLPVTVSYFRADDQIATTEEHPVLFKTSATQAEAAMARIAQLHRYKVPAILAFPASGVHHPFAEWVKLETAA